MGLASDMKLPMATASRCGTDPLALHLVPGDVIIVQWVSSDPCAPGRRHTARRGVHTRPQRT